MEYKIISQEDMASYLWDGLLRGGYCPESEEVEVVAEIMFDYLIYCGAMEILEDE